MSVPLANAIHDAARQAVDEVLHSGRRHRYGTFIPSSRTRRPPHRSATSKLAEAKVQFAIQHAWAGSTLKKYGQGLKAFHSFCNSEGITPEQRLPANEFLLCSFAASRVGEVAGVTARGAIAAVKAWHIIEDAEWWGNLRLRYTLRGVENLTPESSKRDERPPVTADMLDILAADLDHDNPQDAAVFAAACCAFWGQTRLGEILSDTQNTYIPGRIPLVHHLSPPSTRAGSRILKLPPTKTKGDAGDNVMLCRQRGASDPIHAVENHIRVNQLPSDLPLFSHRKANGGLICLTKKKFLLRCNAIWTKHGFPTRTGHSFCIGGTTELLLAGVSPDVVQAMGRWKSDAFLVYWRRLDLLAPLHAEYLEL